MSTSPSICHIYTYVYVYMYVFLKCTQRLFELENPILLRRQPGVCICADLPRIPDTLSGTNKNSPTKALFGIAQWPQSFSHLFVSCLCGCVAILYD